MISHIVGCRPNIIKCAALYPLLGGTIYHTGQHWGEMSDPYFSEYGLPHPRPMESLEGELAIVYGDTRSTLEGALLAKHQGMTIAHVEAGLRCGDYSMDEELNRIAVDHMSDYLFCTEQSAVDNLEAEKVRGEVHLVGNVLADTISRYGVLTLHRPLNVDDPLRLSAIASAVAASNITFNWITHPRMTAYHDQIRRVGPMKRSVFLNLLRGATVIVTDSGGVQEEAAYLGRPCLTIRPSTERPVTLQHGNKLVDVKGLTAAINESIPNIPLWDGNAAKRIAPILSPHSSPSRS